MPIANSVKSQLTKDQMNQQSSSFIDSSPEMMWTPHYVATPLTTALWLSVDHLRHCPWNPDRSGAVEWNSNPRHSSPYDSLGFCRATASTSCPGKCYGCYRTGSDSRA